jgi:hypothetical protein
VCSQRSWSGSSNASTGNVAAFRHSGPSVASEKHRHHEQQQQKVGFKFVPYCSHYYTLFTDYVQYSTLLILLLLRCFFSRTRLAWCCVISLGHQNVVDLGAS